MKQLQSAAATLLTVISTCITLKAHASLFSEYVLPDLHVKMSKNKAGLLQVILAQDTAALVARLVVIKVLKRQFSAAGQKVCVIQMSTTCNQTGSAMWTCIPSACIAMKIVSPVESLFSAQLTCIFLQGLLCLSAVAIRGLTQHVITVAQHCIAVLLV